MDFAAGKVLRDGNDIHIWMIYDEQSNGLKIPVVKEPVRLSMDGKRRDGATHLWVTWQAMVPDMPAKSHLHNSSIQACTAADTAAGNYMTKYAHLATTFRSVPIAVETGRLWYVQAVEFVQDLVKRLSEVANESLETQFLFHRRSAAIQRAHSLLIVFEGSFKINLVF